MILFSEISRILKTDEIDLIILNEAPLSLIHSVFKTGRLFLSKNEEKRISFAKNLKEYIEFSCYRERFFKAMSKRIKEGKFGE
ncbi:MAG: nucleotidyltransferase domain-containing protein [Candidatus Hydrothermales bacterium]